MSDFGKDKDQELGMSMAGDRTYCAVHDPSFGMHCNGQLSKRAGIYRQGRRRRCLCKCFDPLYRRRGIWIRR